MSEKKYSDSEMKDRISLILHELEVQCDELRCDEFEFYYEIWGVMWMPWFLEVNNKSLTFTVNDLSEYDFDYLIEKGHIELIKTYNQSEMKDEFGRKRYRLIKK